MPFVMDAEFLKQTWEATRQHIIDRGGDPDEMLCKAAETVDAWRESGFTDADDLDADDEI